ncbi:MAG TPA: hypothetical protein VLJ42_05890 [Solirubrobacteraceae bacterium]|nr:hypothetical protein [Solirubrobacteraceae bacterium]
MSLTSVAVRALKQRHKLVVALRVRFTPSNGSSASKTVQVNFKRKVGS